MTIPAFLAILDDHSGINRIKDDQSGILEDGHSGKGDHSGIFGHFG